MKAVVLCCVTMPLCFTIMACRCQHCCSLHRKLLNQEAPIPYALYKGDMPKFHASELKQEMYRICEWHMAYYSIDNIMDCNLDIVFLNVPDKLDPACDPRHLASVNISDSIDLKDPMIERLYVDLPKWSLSDVFDELLNCYGLQWKLQDHKIIVWQNATSFKRDCSGVRPH